MFYRLLADLLVLLHMAFVLFAVFGGLLVPRWPRAIYLHLPAAVWAALVEWAGWVCPLTPMEGWLRQLGGEQGYHGGFIEHYLMPVLYPEPLSRPIQIGLALLVVAINAAVYLLVFRLQARSAAARTPPTPPPGDTRRRP